MYNTCIVNYTLPACKMIIKLCIVKSLPFLPLLNLYLQLLLSYQDPLAQAINIMYNIHQIKLVLDIPVIMLFP